MYICMYIYSIDLFKMVSNFAYTLKCEPLLSQTQPAHLDHLRATSYTRLKAHDHCNLRALIGRKGGERPSKFTSHTKVKA